MALPPNKNSDIKNITVGVNNHAKTYNELFLNDIKIEICLCSNRTPDASSQKVKFIGIQLDSESTQLSQYINNICGKLTKIMPYDV